MFLKNKISLLMVHIFFVSTSHLNLLKFKYLAIINLITNSLGIPMYSVAYVQKGYVVSNLIDIWD